MNIPASDELALSNDYIGYQIIVSSVFCAIAAITAVAARLVARQSAKAGLGRDDWAVIVALIVYVLYTIVVSVAARYGLGRHLIYVTSPRGLGVTTLIAECTYNIAVATVKTSVLLFYRRIFIQQWLYRLLWLTGLIVVSHALAQILASLFQCIPIEKTWDPELPGYCIEYWIVILVGTIINVVTDIMTLTLPIPILWGLQTNEKRRKQLIFTFTVGGLACITSIVRAAYTKNLVGLDITWNYVAIIVVSTVEGAAFVVSACIPTYAVFFVQRRSRVMSTNYSRPSMVGTKTLQHIPMSNLGTKYEIWSALGDDTNQAAVTTSTCADSGHRAVR